MPQVGRRIRYFRRIGLVLPAFLLGCSPNFGDIRQEYSKTVRELAIVPVYPPREEFQVGDVFAVSYGPEILDTERLYLGNIPQVADRAEKYMASRIVFRSSGEQGDKDQQDTFGRGLTRRGEITIESLPLAPFPQIQADAGWTGSLGVVDLLRAIGIGGGQRTNVLLSFEDVRTYGVPHVEAGNVTDLENSAALMFLQHSTLVDRELNRRVLIEAAAGTNVESDPTKRCIGGYLVTKVYLTRKITYTYQNNSIVAAGIRRAEAGSDLSTLNPPDRISVNVNVDGNGLITQETGDGEIDGFRTGLDDLAKSGSQGDTLNFEGWDARGISFSQEFDRPVAIAYDGFTFQMGTEGTQPCTFEQSIR